MTSDFDSWDYTLSGLAQHQINNLCQLYHLNSPSEGIALALHVAESLDQIDRTCGRITVPANFIDICRDDLRGIEGESRRRLPRDRLRRLTELFALLFRDPARPSR
jgi:hypothetical protein